MALTKEVVDFVKSVIDRFAWSRWPQKVEVKRSARVARNKYECAHCGELFGTREVQVDHIEPRVNPLTGWVSFDEYIERSLVDVDTLQVLCIPCHQKKSTSENKMRSVTKRKKK